MLLIDLVFKILFFIQTGVGLLENSVLLMLFVSVFSFHTYHKKPTDLILAHLTVANTVILIIQVAPGMILAIRWENAMDVVGCQITLFIRRVARGLSICTTCLLSIFQAITISPSTSRWAQIKPSLSKNIPFVFLFFWVLNFMVEMNILKSTEVSQNVTLTIHVHSRKCCLNLIRGNYLNNVTFLTAKVIRDAVFMFLMSWASGYMVIMLYRHRKQVQHIHSTSLSPKSSAETRATQTILLLVTCFVSFYCINSSLALALNFFEEDNSRLYDPGLFVGACYSFFGPLVLINNDPRVFKLLCPLGRKRALSSFIS
ncbi:vomeronasal 1 receptor ornAnaV1R3229 [Ornithorhynchus anatinus]|uniref:Vomeronasal type-1 receptor n=1 Tax=Ornithorhynchus anatinus TaxID=9258 RepID=A0A6I8PHI6_ORNAN|nr:vomeronasal 1 receptor ornAnaV1R3229 [Ornithorhynchus anatinus]